MSKVHRIALLGSSTATVVALALTSAAAADRDSIKDDQYDRPFIWSGAFVGAHLGQRWGDDRVTIEDGEFRKAISLDPRSIVGGLQGGFNVQAGGVILGLEADVTFGNSGSSFADQDAVARVTVGTHGTLTARLGLPVGQFMPYVKGGHAWTWMSVYGDILPDGAPSGGRLEIQASEKVTGWTIGGGLEYALRGNWTARAEYLFTDYGSLSTTSREGRTHRYDDLDTHSVRFGLNYKLGD